VGVVVVVEDIEPLMLGGNWSLEGIT